MDRPQILVIEDDTSVCELLYACLDKAAFRVNVAQTGESGLTMLEEDRPDLVVLDLTLPGMSGLDVCRSMRQDPWMGKIPVLMLTGRAEEDDIVAGLEIGADDYMTKPFSPKLLTARVMALLRRGGTLPDNDEREAVKGNGQGTLVVKTLGKCELLINGRTLSWAEEFSPAQRQLMSMLVGKANGKISQEEVQTEIWPESPSKKARSSFDSLLSRVRRTLDDTLAPFDSKKYLVVKRGYLFLENSRIDAYEFCRLVRKGSQQAAAREYWPAEITFSSAFSLWQGTFIPGGFGTDVAVAYQDELEQLYLEASMTFARILARNNRLQQATKVLRDALRYEPTNDALVKLLYQLCLAQENPGQAGKILKHYREALGREHFSAHEIEHIMQDFAKIEPGADWSEEA